MVVPEDELNWLVHEALVVEGQCVLLVEWEDEQLIVVGVVIGLSLLLVLSKTSDHMLVESLVLWYWLHNSNCP